MADDSILTVRIGGEDVPTAICANGKLFVFRPEQIHFICNLQRLKSVHAASLSVGEQEEWGRKFLSSAKFRSYLSNKMQEFSDKNSLNVEWWYQFGKWLAEGEKRFYQARCGACGFSNRVSEYEVEGFRKDDMTFEYPCPACFKPMELEAKREDFKPTREQVNGWTELGDRLIPKIERVHHRFDKSEIVFESAEGGQEP